MIHIPLHRFVHFQRGSPVMAKADLHVHSRFSSHPSEWFLQRIGASESYTDPEFVYRRAKERGMSFVTLTDHNTIEGALMLKDRHPGDFFVGMEATAYFPEDRCKVHVLCYGITVRQHDEIQRLRTNIHDLRDYIRAEGIAHSVAHATYSVNDRLTIDHLGKLILLFDVFESRNGARTKLNNQPWMDLLMNLTPGHIERLRDRHGIEPYGDRPWIKGFTGGSDDHAGMFIGRTHTTVEARNIEEFLNNLRNRQSISGGGFSDYQSLAFTIYKVAYDFSKTKSNALSQSLFSHVSEALFDSGTRSLRDTFKLKTYKTLKSRGNGSGGLQELYWDLFDNVSNNKNASIDKKLGNFYDRLALISDEFFMILLRSLERDLQTGDIPNLLKNVSSSLPGIFLTVPFYSTLKHFNRKRNIVKELRADLEMGGGSGEKRILWFTDTLSYMNGVSMTVKKIGWLSYLKNRNLKIVSSFPGDDTPSELPPNVVNLPSIYDFSLPFYEHYTLRIPSLLRSIKMLHDFEPDEVYISTPGPVGLFGLIVARLLNARSIGVYHTDFTSQVHHLGDDAAVDNLVESYLKWFYSAVDENRVPTRQYIDILDERGYDRSKMSVFRRGIDSGQFRPVPDGRDFMRGTFGLPEGRNLLFAGRISRDKNIHFLFDVYEKVAARHGDVNLVIAGEGPDLEELSKKHGKNPRIVFTGRLGHDVLPSIYSGSDLFVFPSTTDTFGMVVLEAHACGLPAMVSEVGGPREIVVEGETGFAADASDRMLWVETISRVLTMIEEEPERYSELRRRSRQRAVSDFDWNAVLDIITSDGSTPRTRRPDFRHDSSGDVVRRSAIAAAD